MFKNKKPEEGLLLHFYKPSVQSATDGPAFRADGGGDGEDSSSPWSFCGSRVVTELQPLMRGRSLTSSYGQLEPLLVTLVAAIKLEAEGKS